LEADAPAAPDPGQTVEVARRPFARRIERWRGLVREVMAEEAQAGTLDGPAHLLDEDLVLAVIQQESQGSPRALSPAGAMGLMQVMPGTLALVTVAGAAPAAEVDPESLWDERTNVRAGLRYLALAMQQQEGNLYWSLASYNAGINAARRWRLAGLYAVPPIGGYAETAGYAQIILRNYLAHRPGLEMYVPDPMPPEHVAGAMQLLREFRRRGA
jgi:soluble lytic murein transglycosylase-like protein